MTKYLILCANCAHPSGELKFFLLTDADDNTVEFETENAAKKWCADAGTDGPLAYTILCSDDFTYERLGITAVADSKHNF